MAFDSIISKAWLYAKKLYHALRLDRMPWLKGILGSFGNGVLRVASAIAKTKFHPGGNWGTEMRFVLGLYETDSVACAKRFIKPGMVVLDVGADIGYYTKLFSRLVGSEGKVYAFEPHEQMYEVLRKNVGRGNHNNVVAIKKALAQKEGTASFFNMQHMGRHSLYNVADYYEGLTVAKTTTVAITTFDAFAAKEQIMDVDFFKIDVEGGELDVLSGAKEMISRNAGAMGIIEYNPANLLAAGRQPHDLLDTLKAFGFQVKEIGKKGVLLDVDSKTLAAGKESVNLFCFKPLNPI